ncbi:MAG: GGDEF domain-containing protein [Pirellulales bacterium]|nr:GGDEF domain-containing protein [Pirellulales bacterium]
MHALSHFWPPFFYFMLGFAGISGLLAIISPKAFAAVAGYSNRLVNASQTDTVFDKWIDIDRFVLQHARYFGLLVTVSVVYLWFLWTYGRNAGSSSFLIVIVSISLMMGTLSLVQISIQKKQIESHQSQAHTDVLTGLANRRSFDMELARRLTQRQRQGTSLALILIDLDHFKTINDTCGHHVGDEALQFVAKILSETAPTAAMVCRIGGDEFAVILVGETLRYATRVGERFRTAVANRTVSIDDKEHHFTLSIGISEAQPDDDPTSCVKRSDSALYSAKAAGRNRCFVQGGPEPALPEPCAV